MKDQTLFNTLAYARQKRSTNNAFERVRYLTGGGAHYTLGVPANEGANIDEYGAALLMSIDDTLTTLLLGDQARHFRQLIRTARDNYNQMVNTQDPIKHRISNFIQSQQ